MVPFLCRRGRGGFVQLPIIGGLNQPPRLRPLWRLRGISLMGAATPPYPRRGIPAHSVFLVCCKLSGQIRSSELLVFLTKFSEPSPAASRHPLPEEGHSA